MFLTNWFDPTNIEHLKAWQFLGETGYWPKDFIPDNVIIDNTWQIGIAVKMANLFVRLALGNQIVGIPENNAPLKGK